MFAIRSTCHPIRVREVLRSALEEATADPASSFVTLAGDLLKIETWRASYWKTAINPYGSEFAFDTTGMEEVSSLIPVPNATRVLWPGLREGPVVARGLHVSDRVELVPLGRGLAAVLWV